MSPAEQEQYLISLRRERLQQLLAMGVSQTKAAAALHVSEATITHDTQYLKQHAKDYLHNYSDVFEQRWKEVMDMCDALLLESWQATKGVKFDRWKAPLLSVTLQILLAKAQLASDVSLIDKVSSFLADTNKRKDHLIGLPPPPTDALATVVTDGVTEQVLEQSADVEPGDEQDASDGDTIEDDELHEGTE
jgi:hypothetical protein